MSDDLLKRLGILSGMLKMCEPISFGADSQVMDEAATRIRELEAQLAAAEAAGVAKGLEMAVNYCRDCAKNFESISASATDQRTAAFSFNQKLTWEGAAENIAALSPPTGMVLVPREKLQRLIDYTVNPTPTNMDDRKALDWVNGQACAMLGATRE